MYRLQKIDELHLRSHKYLTSEDECYYFMDYTAPASEHKTEENRIILNFKKKMDRKGRWDWDYKRIAIQDVSKLFIQNVPPIISRDAIMVPVPPSRAKEDPLYDDRLVQLVKNYCKEHPLTEYREIVSLKSNIKPTHEEEKTPAELMPMFNIDKSLCSPKKEQIIIVDDVLRHGAHFKAIKKLLQAEFPGSKFIGLYIARTRY